MGRMLSKSGVPLILASMEQGHSEHHLLEQAPVKAVDADGVFVFALGTAVFAVASLVLAWQRPALVAAHQEWFLWTAIVATALGCAGLAFSLTRRRKGALALSRTDPDRP